MDIIERVFDVIVDRKRNPSTDSYVSRLLASGEEKVLKKVGEEAVEVLLAAKAGDDQALVYELTDLLFHSLVLMGARGIEPSRVADELERRFGVSGLQEKASRTR